MDIAHSVDDQPATPEFVLAVFRDWLRQDLPFEVAEGECPRTLETVRRQVQVWEGEFVGQMGTGKFLTRAATHF